jgi:hypothetical protein
MLTIVKRSINQAQPWSTSFGDRRLQGLTSISVEISPFHGMLRYELSHRYLLNFCSDQKGTEFQCFEVVSMVDEFTLFLSVVTLGELRKGVEKLPSI